MFDQLKQLCNNIININSTELSVSVFALPEIKQFILRLNRVEQLYLEGLDVNDRIIGTYSYLTALEAGEESYIFNGLVSNKRVGEPYTLFDTGEFYDSFKVRILSDGFVIEADTQKDDGDLIDKYGEILGLTQNSKDELAQKIKPFIIDALQRYFLKEVL